MIGQHKNERDEQYGPHQKGGGWIQVLQMQSFTDQCSGVYYPVRSKFIISRWTIKYIILPAERHRLVCISNLHTYIICSSVRYIFFKYYFSYLRSLSLRRFLIFWLGTLVYLLSMFFYLFNLPIFFIYLTYQSFDYDLTQRRLFQKHIVWNKLDIYLNISLMYGIWSFIHKMCTILHILRVIQYNYKSSLYAICTNCIEHYCFVNEPSLHNDKL